MSTLPTKRYSVEEYLDLEEGADYKSQFYNGEIFAMAGASFPHNQIALNIAAELREKLRGTPCQALPSDVLIKCRTGLFTYADAVVVCGEPEVIRHRGLDVLLNPKVIVEVLSESTESFDRGKKFTHYKTIDSFEEYLLVAQDRYFVDHFQRDDDGSWRLNSVTGLDGTVKFGSVTCSLLMSQIYERVHITTDDWAGSPDPPEERP
jgi:Uma2 family endonuclease